MSVGVSNFDAVKFRKVRALMDGGDREISCRVSVSPQTVNNWRRRKAA